MRLFQHDSRWTILACVYAGYVLVATLYPFEITRDLLQLLTHEPSEFFKPTSSRDFVLNILLFLPFGFFCYPRLASNRGTLAAILLATLAGVLFSTAIELLQGFFSRRPSAFDVLSNTLGTSSGALLSALWARQRIDLVSRLWTRPGVRRIAVAAAAIYGVIPLILSVVQFVAPFQIWSPRFSFQIGNEATVDRPWLGKLHFVALYNRALPADEITQNFNQGFASAMSKRRTDMGLIALYAFSEGRGDVAHDTSGLEPSLDLVISPEHHVQWLGPKGVEIVRPAILRSQEAGAKLVKAVAQTHELSIEVWMTPHDTRQAGPARIVSLSRDPGTRNFTLGQQGANIQFRLRTPVTGKNGTPRLTTTTGVLGHKPVHIVATYKEGIQALYANGVEQPESFNLSTDGIVGFGTRKTAVAQVGYSFFYFFPTSFLLAALFSKRSRSVTNTLLIPVAVGTGLLGTTEIFQAFVFDRAIDIPLIIYGMIVLISGAIGGTAFIRAETIRPTTA